ncbi:hypothetical protein HY995_01425 [Candidatus Micrarchaeota archaeon]|nr:hypothetical protein [Candidatus Micrarchaeota archaeon]MBI5176727.1 hypothetical protein [Candidatus Micrarchaeota archaeon]
MLFHGFFDSAFGSHAKARVLKHLLREEKTQSEREIARLVGLSHVAVNKTLKEFHDLNLASPARVGNVTSWVLNKEGYAYWAVTHLGEAVHHNPRQDLKRLLHAFYSSNLSVERVVLYGPVGEGRELPNSPIDLFILVTSEKAAKEVAEMLPELQRRCIARYGNGVSAKCFLHSDLVNPANAGLLKKVEAGTVIKE